MKKLPIALNTPARVVIAVGLVILVSEFLIMLLIRAISRSTLKEATLETMIFEFIDPILLIAIVSPILYTMIFRPMSRQAETIRDSRDKLSQLLNSIVEGAYGVDTHGNCTFVNQSCLQMLGYQNNNELLGKHMHTLMCHSHADGSPYSLSECKIYRAFQVSQIVNVADEVFWRKDGSSFPVEYWSNPIVVDGVAVGAILTFVNITERKRAEEAVRISALKHQLLFESSRDALMTLAPPSWKFTEANQATLQLFGASSVAEFIALGPWDVSPEQQPDGRLSSEKAQEMIATAMREGSRFFEWEHQRLDGQPFAADVLLTRMNVGEDVFLQATVRDITERKRAEESLQQERAKLLKTERELLKAYESLAEADRLESAGRLAAGVAHEVKNPLAIIRLGVDYLSKQFSQESNKEILDDVRGAIDRADNVIKDLLDLSRQQSFVRRPININQVIDNAIRFVKHKIERRNIAIVRSRNDPMPLIYADPDRLVQVFINLLSNAAQAIGQDGSIEIVTRSICLSERDFELPGTSMFRIGEQVVAVEIRDNGPGFPAEYGKKLFEPFFTTKPMGEGSGLGLAVSRSIVIMHRGSISISNRPEGGASALLMFRVYREHLKNE